MAKNRNLPTLFAYYVQKDGQRKAIGAAWPARSGDGFYVVLNELPQNGKFLLVTNKNYRSDEVVDNFERHVV